MESGDSKWCADMGYRDDDFRRDQDRRYENFRDDLAWKQKVRDRDSSLARDAIRRGETAWALHHIGATDAAIDLLRSGSAAPDYSDMAQECIERGVACIKAGDYENAKGHLTEALGHEASNADALLYRAECYRVLGLPSLAIEDYDAADIAGADRAVVCNGKGLAYVDSSEYDKASVQFGLAISYAPGFAAPYFNRGLLLLREGREAEAEAQFDTAIGLDKCFCPPLIERARLRMGRGDYEAVILDTSRWLELRPGAALAFRMRGSALAGMRRWDAAIADLDEAIKRYDSDAFAWLCRSQCRRETGDLEGSLADADAAVHYAEDWHLPYFERALVKRKLGDAEGALADLDAALSLKPDFAAGFNERGFLRLNSGMPDKALEDFDRAVEHRPDFAWFHYDRGHALMDMKRNLLAAAAFRQAARLFERGGQSSEQARALARMEEMLR